jgi:hypothetical protein
MSTFDFRWEERVALDKRVAKTTPVTIPSSKNGTLVWLMSDGTFTVRVPKADYDGPGRLIPEADPVFDPPAFEWRYCCSITVLEFCKCVSEDPLSLIYLDGVPLTTKKN